MATESVTSEDAIEVFKQLEVYPWDTDKDFQVSEAIPSPYEASLDILHKDIHPKSLQCPNL
jgi:hypothetical protein